jgi:hypothetical protein
MKKMCIAIVLVALALWVGISVGYHDGMREERMLWEATAQSEQKGIVTLENEPARHETEPGRFAYRNPHLGVVAQTSAWRVWVMNVPDPRTYRQFERSGVR